MTGMSISEIEKQLPNMQEQINSANQQYNSLLQLAELKTQRDAANGMAAYEQINTQYQAALQAAGLDETSADAMYAQLDSMQTEINNSQAQYEQLCAVVNAKKNLDEKWSAYNKAASQAKGADQQLASAKTELDKGEKEYSAKQQEIQSASSQLSAAETKLANAKQEYKSGTAQYNSKKAEVDKKLTDAKKKLDDASAKISKSEKELKDGWSKYNDKKPDADKEIADAQEKVTQAQDTLNKLNQPVYALDTRREVPGSEGYRIYSSVSNIVDSLASVFPIFLYFVAALVTLTTMTRFVDEERINSGTLKALGYSNQDIIKKFTVYGLIASTAGAVIGIALGHTLLPTIVYNAYGHSFTYPQIELHFYPVISIIALILAFMCAVVPAFIVANKELKEKPSSLLMPKPPEAGSKILLERITPIWSRMNFTHKVTARNIFRYKKRMLMTIFGVCGSVTLIFAGFSVQHSISGVKDRQFGEIMKYDLIVAQNDGLNDQQQSEVDKLLADDSVDSEIPIHYETVNKVAGKNQDKQEIKLIVPKEAEKLNQYISLVDRNSKKKLELTDDGCVISERLARLLNVGIGDTFEITDSENNTIQLKVSAVTEMYMGHFIFTNNTYYQQAFNKGYSSNANLVTLKDRSTSNAQQQASRFIELDGVKGVVQNTTLMNQIDTIVNSLNKIMQILIIVAILLAVVILYNLTNINVSERIRELSTIKVLGFYNNEVTMYIYRETIILTLLGILTGFALGDGLYLYIISIVPPDDVMFNPALGAKAFIIPVIVITVITIVLGLIMNRRLKNVDMLGALKSVE
ncbi:MAG: FtsX-like permease family protein [Ruminococcus sp.]|nr:FtsX-like permease family protein [Ruminococcus sp.]MDD6447403.1 FtsX-like permease family protein [Ruminococcus sp.]